MLALLIGCGLRRGELLSLRVESIQLREEHWVIADLSGKAGHVRTVPIPSWVKAAIDDWTAAADIGTGRVFRAINKAGRVWGDGMTAKVLWEVVREGARRAGIENWPLTIYGERARASAIWPVASWTRFSFSWATCRSKQRNAISDANRSSAVR